MVVLEKSREFCMKLLLFRWIVYQISKNTNRLNYQFGFKDNKLSHESVYRMCWMSMRKPIKSHEKSFQYLLNGNHAIFINVIVMYSFPFHIPFSLHVVIFHVRTLILFQLITNSTFETGKTRYYKHFNNSRETLEA